jgi:hypothetical protein
MSKLTQLADRPASITTDLGFAVLVGFGAAVLVAIAPLNWIPIIGPHLPGIAGGVAGALYYVRARWNNPLNLGP